ncbi:nuclease-related domain-containing DEAD/DEAH box helicase [Curtobacterium ammoniigenes]|uniref:nuclease-related domain-containing DEAD/DEAH box helicase n=1 Tax=Curtobacterium ammoniigenes TaxID=395387 RepID=UPI00082B4D53|nr:UvrD-helicase domain-containing protein [Curtobacterium ammoniigenes]
MAAEHERLAVQAREAAERWMLAHRTERHVAGSLAPLTAAGYSFLHDRGWPGSRSRAQIDHVLVGPGGLFIVDTKAWADVEIAAGHIFRGQADVTDELGGLADVGYGTEAVMADLGLAPGEVHVGVVLAGRALPPTEVSGVVVVGEKQAARHVNSYGKRLTDTQVNAVLGAALVHFPVLDSSPIFLDTSIAEPVLAEAEPEPLLDIEEVTDILLAGLLAAPIEEWMAFLHPSQAKLVRRGFNGPARIRGAAGTGKTVVGLHRAAYLARAQGSRVLFTSYVRTLPEVQRNLLARLAPEAVERVEFVGVHAFALRLLKQRGIRLNVDPVEEERSFVAAWRTVGLGAALAQSDPNPNYWRDEIRYVIKGRGLSRFEQYADLVRTGRKRPLGLELRREVWRLFVAYEAELRARHLHDFDDVILRAEASLRETPTADYGSVIIDEAQDLTCAMVRMLFLLVGDRPDGLTLIGDGQQSIYPGGFSLTEAGVSIAGRGVVMSTNYRNTKEIAAFAASVIEGDQYADIEGNDRSRDEAADIPRTGPEPTSRRFSSRREHDKEFVAQLKALPCPPGDVGVLCLTNQGVREAARALSAAGIPVLELTKYEGLPVDAVKVGTIKRAKGLEFKQVLLPRVPPALMEQADADDEAMTIHRRELYVGMTRARDGLWVGVCA